MATQTTAVANAVLWPVYSPEQQVVKLIGSFQGNGGSSPTAGHTRGAWVGSVTRTAGGTYRVLVSLNIPNALVSSQDTGLLGEARAWVSGETAGTAPVKYCCVQTATYDTTTNVNTFYIFVYDIAGAALYDVTSADRVNFEIAWKNTATLP